MLEIHKPTNMLKSYLIKLLPVRDLLFRGKNSSVFDLGRRYFVFSAVFKHKQDLVAK